MLKLKTALIICALIFSAGCNQKTGQKPWLNNNKKIAQNTIGVRSFIFVGMKADRPAIYRFDFKSGKSKLFWYKPDESVVSLLYSSDKKFAFFVTALSYGKSGASFYIRNAKAYLINLQTLNINFISSLGDGIQLFTSMGVDNSFKVIINSIDKKIATYLNQNTKIFNTYGKLVYNKTETYNLAKNGYPVPQKQNLKINSPDNKYSIKVIEDSAYTEIYLADGIKNTRSLIAGTTQKLNDIAWNDDKYIFLSTIDLSKGNKSLWSKSPETSKLFIYSIGINKILKSWDGSGIKNFLLLNHYLIFDDGFGNRSVIYVFDYKRLKLIKNIKIAGGCGINKIPGKPETSS